MATWYVDWRWVPETSRNTDAIFYLQVDRAVDAVGYQAVDKEGSKEQPNIVLDQLIMVTRACGK